MTVHGEMEDLSIMARLILRSVFMNVFVFEYKSMVLSWLAKNPFNTATNTSVKSFTNHKWLVFVVSQFQKIARRWL
jgi:hypothetical protein